MDHTPQPETANLAVSHRHRLRPAIVRDLDVSEAAPLGALTIKQFRAALRSEVVQVLDLIRREQDGNAAGLSAAKAATLARCRRDTVLNALASGALPGVRHGKRWHTTAGQVRSWIEKGRPQHSSALAS